MRNAEKKKTEGRVLNAEFGMRNAEKKKTEGGEQRSEDRADDRGQRTEDRVLKIEAK